MKASLIVVISFVAISCVVAQASVKPGACSPALPIAVCENVCTADNLCPGSQKCCRTKCGGSVCSLPVTGRTRVNRVKPGYCPNPPTGPWVCSSSCSVDVECRGRAKCCKNRCGALRCINPVTNPLPAQPGPASIPAFPGRRPS